MALAATTVWEVQANATAANANGGGFNPSNTGNGGTHGTDFSQQTAAQYSFSNLAATNGNTATPSITSASHNFTGVDCGNLIHITAGTNWTQGWYEIVSTSANAATLDRACASVASPTSGTFSVGGALSLGSSTANQTDASFASATVAGNTVWIKNGSYTPTSMTFTAATVSASSSILGYNASRGDAPTGANRPTLSMTTSALSLGAFKTFENIIVTGSSASMCATGGSCTINNSKFTNTSTTTARVAVTISNADLLINSEITSQNGIGVASTSANANVVSCYIHDCNAGYRATGTAAQILLEDNIFAGNFFAAVDLTGANVQTCFIGNNTIYGAEEKLGVGVNLASAVANVRLANNILYGLTTGVSAAATTNSWSNWNDFNNNTTNRTNWSVGASDVSLNPQFANVTTVSGTAGAISGSTLTASGFGNVVDNQDYVYISSGTGVTTGVYLITSHTSTVLTLATAPGGSGTDIHYSVRTGQNFAIGTNLKALGDPGVFPGGLTTGYLDIGAVQRQEPTTAVTFGG